MEKVEDKWEVIRAENVTVTQGYKCRNCGIIYGNEMKEHCKPKSHSIDVNGYCNMGCC